MAMARASAAAAEWAAQVVDVMAEAVRVVQLVEAMAEVVRATVAAVEMEAAMEAAYTERVAVGLGQGLPAALVARWVRVAV
jgi:hypothetical protein